MKNDFVLANYFISYVAALLFFGVGAITTLGLDWYTTLSVPAWTPSDSVIAVVWCVLFLLSGISACLVWDDAPRDASFRPIIGLYMGNALLVLLWNYLFFGLHALLPAFIVGALVGVTVLVLVLWLWRISNKASLLLVPYFVWIVIALYLTYLIVRLNA